MKEFKGSKLEIHPHEPKYLDEKFKQEFDKQVDKRKQLYDAINRTVDKLYKETSVVHYSPIEQALKQWYDGIKDAQENIPEEIKE